jgi:hypothetical protein
MFRIDQTKTHGMGWIATCDIPSQMSILDEHASFQIPRRVLFNDPLVRKSLEHISDEDRASLESLYGKDLSTKLYMNAHRMMIDQSLGQPLMPDRFNNMLGIYLLCARLNHSCRPNAIRVVGEDVMSVVSQTDIRAGEEITISYLDDNFLVAEERSKQLRSKLPSDDVITYSMLRGVAASCARLWTLQRND